MGDALELKTFPDNNNVANDEVIEVIPGNGTNEDSNLLSPSQAAANNSDDVDEVVVVVEPTDKTSRCRRELQSLKERLNEVVVWRLRLWVVILLVLILIILVFGITLIALTVEEDADENFDKSTFVVKRLFWGNFTLSKSSFTSYPVEQRNLTEQLNEQLTDVYSSSPALGRFFSSVNINEFQNATARFELQFVMPLEHEDLTRFTLSVKMVRNVLLQHFYVQDPREPLYVIPTSLNMQEHDKILN